MGVKSLGGVEIITFFWYISLLYYRLMLVHDVIDYKPSNMAAAGKLELPL